MRGQQAVVAFVLIAAIGVLLTVTYYLHTQGLFFQTKSAMQQEIDEYTHLSERYIEISSANAKIRTDINVVQLMITITNTGSSTIPLYGSSLYVYKQDDVLVFARPVALTSPICPNPLPSGATCMFSVEIVSSEYFRPDDVSNSHLVMYINDSRKESDIEYVGEIQGNATYYECDSYDSCLSRFSDADADPGSIVLVDMPEPASGDGIKISGVSDVTVYCRTKLLGNDTGAGILIEDSNNISIRSCDVKNFEYGVRVKNSQNLSFSTAYFHDNSIDLAFDDDTLEDVCTVDSASVVTTSGYIHFATGTQGAVPVLGASAIWLIGTNASAFNGKGTTLSRVSPAVAFCNTSSVSAASFNVADTDVGVSLIEDSGTRLEAIDVRSNVYGIYSQLSSNTYICCSTIYSGVGDMFVNPSSMEWDAKTIFAG